MIASSTFVSVGNAYVRVDQVAAVTDYEIILIDGAGTLPLGDDVEADEVVDKIIQVIALAEDLR
jgi:hypothetical protein